MDAAADKIAQMLLTNQGQICSLGSQLLVQHSVETAMVEKITARLSQIVMGDAMDPKTTFGPLVSAKQCARATQYIETAEADGAQLVAGGCRTPPEIEGGDPRFGLTPLHRGVKGRVMRFPPSQRVNRVP